MSWITIIWSAALGACLMLALMHLLIWFLDRRSWANLLQSLIALVVIWAVIISGAETPPAGSKRQPRVQT